MKVQNTFSSSSTVNPTSLRVLSNYFSAHSLLAFSGILFLALLLRLPNLAESLWLDELWSIRIILDNTDPLRTLLRDIHPPLYSIFMFSWIRLFGDSELSIRLPSLVFGLVSVQLPRLRARLRA